MAPLARDLQMRPAPPTLADVDAAAPARDAAAFARCVETDWDAGQFLAALGNCPPGLQWRTRFGTREGRGMLIVDVPVRGGGTQELHLCESEDPDRAGRGLVCLRGDALGHDRVAAIVLLAGKHPHRPPRGPEGGINAAAGRIPGVTTHVIVALAVALGLDLPLPPKLTHAELARLKDRYANLRQAFPAAVAPAAPVALRPAAPAAAGAEAGRPRSRSRSPSGRASSEDGRRGRDRRERDRRERTPPPPRRDVAAPAPGAAPGPARAAPAARPAVAKVAAPTPAQGAPGAAAAAPPRADGAWAHMPLGQLQVVEPLQRSWPDAWRVPRADVLVPRENLAFFEQHCLTYPETLLYCVLNPGLPGPVLRGGLQCSLCPGNPAVLSSTERGDHCETWAHLERLAHEVYANEGPERHRSWVRSGFQKRVRSRTGLADATGLNSLKQCGRALDVEPLPDRLANRPAATAADAEAQHRVLAHVYARRPGPAVKLEPAELK